MTGDVLALKIFAFGLVAFWVAYMWALLMEEESKSEGEVKVEGGSSRSRKEVVSYGL
jgi:hypothetical protein